MMEIYLMDSERSKEEFRIMKGYTPCYVYSGGQHYRVDIVSTERHFNEIQNEMERTKDHGNCAFLCSGEILVPECSDDAVVAAVEEAAEEGVLPCFPQVSLIDWDKGEREDAFLHANVTFPDGRMMNKHLLRYQGRLFSLVIEKRDRPATHFLLRNDHDDEGELRGIIDMLAENGLFADFEPYYTIAMTELRPFWKGSITEAG